ncbi:phakinin [Echinops telfairi]|uniref:Phakinin n=1 Tax=Echinops telfairi TaxID=9371 RepID=A0ABM0J6L6_ECHTE|nr:phakinin [Echinops telfairi]
MAEAEGVKSERQVVVDAPPSASSSMSLQRCRMAFRGTQPSSPWESSPGSRANPWGRLARSPVAYVGTMPIGLTGSQGARVTCRALGISSIFLQGLRSSGWATAPVPDLEGSHGAAKDLGACLVEYIAKVHTLERVNRDLETQLRELLGSKAKASGGWGPLKATWASSCQQVGEAVLENARLVLQKENTLAGADELKKRYESEQLFRKAAEEEIKSLYKVIDEAHLTKLDLESQIEGLKEELDSLTRNYEEDVKVLYKELSGSEQDRVDMPVGTGLDDILETVRIFWERDVEKKRMEAEPLLQAKQHVEGTHMAQSQEAKLATALRVELHDTTSQVQSLRAETESLQALKRGLENTLRDAERWHDMEMQNLGAVVGRLEAELGEVRAEAELRGEEQERLRALNCQLQKEVAACHALLDREADRY